MRRGRGMESPQWTGCGPGLVRRSARRRGRGRSVGNSRVYDGIIDNDKRGRSAMFAETGRMHECGMGALHGGPRLSFVSPRAVSRAGHLRPVRPRCHPRGARVPGMCAGRSRCRGPTRSCLLDRRVVRDYRAQGGKCNFNLWTLGILNLLALALGGLGAGIGFWNLGISQGIASLQEALGAGIGSIGNFGILGLQGALGAGSGIGNFGILGLQGALGPRGGWDVQGCPPPLPPKRCAPRSAHPANRRVTPLHLPVVTQRSLQKPSE